MPRVLYGFWMIFVLSTATAMIIHSSKIWSQARLGAACRWDTNQSPHSSSNATLEEHHFFH